MSERHALIELREVTKTYRSSGLAVEVLHGITLAIDEGEFVALMGQSGSGKTTLMNLIGCLDRPTTGAYLFAGRDVSRLGPDELAELRRNTFGFIFQRYNLIASQTAAQNVEIPAIYAGMARRRRLARAHSILETLGLADRLEHLPPQLSGGQQQRVSVARALMNGGRVILADEPTGALDSQSGAEVLTLLHELHRAGHTIILITHNDQIANEAERIIQLKDGLVVSDAGRSSPRADHGTAGAAAAPPDPIAQRGGGVLPDLTEAAKMALQSLRVNPLRTFLTLLGIIIGVGAVVTMVALGDGSKAEVLARIEAMGSDLLVVRPGARNVRLREESAALIADDATAIEEEIPGVKVAVPDYSRAVTVRYGENDYVTNGIGTGGAYARARNWRAARGSFFSDADVQSYAPVIVLGQTVASMLFASGEDPVGQHVLVDNVPFLVVGVLVAKGATTTGSDMDDAVFMPLTTGRMRLFGRRYVHAITVQVADVNAMSATQDAINTLLLARHGRQDFRIRNMASLLETASETQNTLTLLLGSIAAISLLVGGIGVMNIMLVSVTERVREIGIRMATGARRLHILLQFNVEALALSSMGAVIGVAGGLAGAWAAERFGLPVAYSVWPVLVAFASALAVGLIFGYMPARRAARLDPVVALAAE